MLTVLVFLASAFLSTPSNTTPTSRPLLQTLRGPTVRKAMPRTTTTSRPSSHIKHPTHAIQPISRSTTQSVAPNPATRPNQRWSAAQLLYRMKGCEHCHSLDGTGGLGPSLAGLARTYATLHTGQKILRDRKYLSAKITDSSQLELVGHRNIMPIYRDGLTPAEITLLADWLLSIPAPSRHSPTQRP